MPTPNPSTPRARRGAYSVTEVAKLCGLSRARFYDLVRDRVMPQPVYCTRTRRPLYTAELLALCQRVKETNTGIDGRYVIFYQRRGAAEQPVGPRARAASAPDPLLQEMIESLRAMNVQATDAQLRAAIAERCPSGLREEAFEADLRAIFDALRCRNGA